jgi:uncharacterized protein (TIGR02145 family)
MKNKNYLRLLLVVLLCGFITICGCKKDETEDPPVTPPVDETTVTDVDGNVYNIITIGSQKWMKENLRTSKYRDGSAIPNITDNAAWIGLSSGAWCYYENDVTNNATYGKLYNFYAVADSRNLAPSGWHVARESDWNSLITFVGGATVAGGKLKEAGTSHWSSPNTGATNNYNFTAVPGGNRFTNGAFYQLGSEGFYWTSTVSGSDAKNMFLTFVSAEIFSYTNPKKVGYSVRCVKD